MLFLAPGFRILLGALALASGLPLAGHAETQIRKSTSYFAITGRNAGDLDRALQRHGPLTQNTGSRHPGATEIKFGGELTYVHKNGECTVSNVRVTLTTHLILPRWKNRAKADRELGMIWDTLSADIKRHEERHAEIARTHARSIDARLRALPPQPSCDTLQKQVNEAMQESVATHDRDQLRFDRVEAANFEKRMMRLIQYRQQSDGSSK
jgi:predicted secreted Zn-dependent protease